MLTPYQSYTLAQDSHLSSQICITSSDPLAKSYNYCLEFVCYNTKNVPKAQYISTVLEYLDSGITFDIPNNLTQYRGHTDMQLTGYDKTNNEIIFKSVAKGARAFDVEGSLCVLENSISDTPNVITEILNQLDYLTDIKENLVAEFLASANKEFSAVLSNYTWHTVKFYNRDILLKSACFIEGYPINVSHIPTYTLPPGCVVEGGWYNGTTNKIWRFETDLVMDDVSLYANYYTEGLSFSTSSVVNYTGNSTSVYLPRGFNNNGVKYIAGSALSATHNFALYLNENISTTLGMFNQVGNITTVYIPIANTFFEKDGVCIVEKVSHAISKVCATNPNQGVVNCPSYSSFIGTNAICRSPLITKLNLPIGLVMLSSKSIVECNGLTQLVVPSGVVTIQNLAVYNCANLKKIIMLPLIPPTIGPHSFSLLTSPNEYINCDLYVPHDSLNAYKAHSLYSGYKIFSINELVA